MRLRNRYAPSPSSAMKRKRIILLAGFLGAGKTTLLKKMAARYRERAAFIVNEFGKEDVDGKLLESEGLAIRKITNGSIFCACRSENFIDALILLAGENIDLLIVEASGISDPGSLTTLIATANKLAGGALEYAGCIALADATNFLKLKKSLIAVTKQVAEADLILINKTDLVPRESVQEIADEIGQINPGALLFPCAYCDIEDWEAIDRMKHVEKSGKSNVSTDIPQGAYRKLTFYPSGDTKAHALLLWLQQAGKLVFRIKGYVSLANGDYFVDCTPDGESMSRWDGPMDGSFLVVIYDSRRALLPELKKLYLKITGKEFFYSL